MKNNQGKNEIVREIVKVIDIVLLIVHIYLLIFFALLHINVMVVVNVVSVSVYAIMIQKSQEKFEKFVLVAYYEILLHMILAVVCVGWEFGFQFYSVSLIPVIFYYDFLNNSKQGKRYCPIIISMIVVAVYCILRWYTWSFGAIYEVSNTNVKLLCNLINALFIFVFLIFYMANYEKLTIHTDNLASKDKLTGLDNRHRMDEIMHMILEKHGNQEIAVAIMDIDDFKKVNDIYGHNVGDIVLKSVADTIKEVQDNNIFVCRWGGEEFLVITYGKGCYQKIQSKLSELVKSISEKKVEYDDGVISVTITAGVSLKIEEETIDKAISRADMYLYKGKNSGKNRLVAED